MRDEVLSSVGAQEGLVTSGYQVSADLDVDFYWGNDQLDVDAVFRPGFDTLFSPTAFEDLEMGGSAENPILLDKEEDRENSPPTTTTLVPDRPTRPPPLLRSRPFGVSLSLILLVSAYIRQQVSAYIKPIQRKKWNTIAKSKVKVFAKTSTRSIV